MPKNGWGGKSQLFKLNYIYGVFQLQNSKKKTFTRFKKERFLPVI